MKTTYNTACLSAGIGRSVGLILIVPIILLFSYSKTYKSTKLDPFIPIGGIGFIAFIYFEGLFLVISQNIPILIENLNNMTAAL